MDGIFLAFLIIIIGLPFVSGVEWLDAYVGLLLQKIILEYSY